MKVVHIAGSISRKAGGLFDIVRRLAQEELSLGCEVEILGGEDEFSDKDAGLWAPLQPRIYAVNGPASFGFSPEIKESLDEWMPDVVHLHGLWQYPSYAASKWVRRHGAKYIISPQGMLDAWALRNSGWKKKLAGSLYERKSLRSAACVHALTDKEVCDIRQYGVVSPVCVIPNGADIPREEFRVQSSGFKADNSRQERDKKNVLLFLGRLHPKKGLDGLLRAWAVVSKKVEAAAAWRLVVAGWDDGGHEAGLHQLASALGITDSVEFSGSVYGDDKDAALKSADAFILPSLSEGLPMAVLEAWAYGLPVLMTEECNLPQGFLLGGALAIGADVGSICGGISRLFAMSEAERMSMGLKGKEIVEKEFAWRSQADKMLAVYNWMLTGEESPSCVR